MMDFGTPFHTLIQLSSEPWSILPADSAPLILHNSQSANRNDLDAQENTTKTTTYLCQGCGKEIVERYMLEMMDYHWHEGCLRCDFCKRALSTQVDNTCFVSSDGFEDPSVKICCKEDQRRFLRLHCFNCEQPIRRGDYFHRCPPTYAYHARCFKCGHCQRPLNKGDSYRCLGGSLVCEEDFPLHQTLVNAAQPHRGFDKPGEVVTADQQIDYRSSSQRTIEHPQQPVLNQQQHYYYETPPQNGLVAVLANSLAATPHMHHMSACRHHHSRHSSRRSMSKRPRTILNAQQRRAFKHAFDRGPKPSRKVREQLARDTGLSVRVVQVWFQNQRAKTKKEQRRQESRHSTPRAQWNENGRKDSSSGRSTADNISVPPNGAETTTTDDISPCPPGNGVGEGSKHYPNHFEGLVSIGVAHDEELVGEGKNAISRLYDMHKTYFT